METEKKPRTWKLKRPRRGMRYVDEEGYLRQVETEPLKKYTKQDKKLYKQVLADSDEAEKEREERRRRNGQGLQKFTAYL